MEDGILTHDPSSPTVGLLTHSPGEEGMSPSSALSPSSMAKLEIGNHVQCFWRDAWRNLVFLLTFAR
jgi:hypothetical protein